MNDDKTPAIDALTEELARLKEANKLLFAVYVEIGPYQDGKPSDKTWQEVCKFFKFDDSE